MPSRLMPLHHPPGPVDILAPRGRWRWYSRIKVSMPYLITKLRIINQYHKPNNEKEVSN